MIAGGVDRRRRAAAAPRGGSRRRYSSIVGAHRPEAGGQRRDAVAFLDAQLARRRAPSAPTRRASSRASAASAGISSMTPALRPASTAKLRGCAERRRARGPIGSPASLVLDVDVDRAPGAAKDVEHGRARRVQADALDVDVARRACRPRAPPRTPRPRCRPGPSSVARRAAAARRRRRPRSRRGRPSTPNAVERALRMIACRRRARRRVVRPSRCRPGEQHGALHLGARDLGLVGRCRAGAPPSIVSGGRPSSDSMRAPIRVSGSMTRRIGRR